MIVDKYKKVCKGLENMERENFWRVLEILRTRTNEDQGISIKEIQDYLQYHYGEKRTRNTLIQDITAYERLGFDIRQESTRHNQYVYKLVDREFTFDEVRILVDSISINQFLTWEQKKQIIDKFNAIISTRDINRLKSTIKINHCIHPEINLIENIKRVHIALAEKKFIIFHYGRYNEKKQFVLKDKDYLVIPKEIIYKQDRYYLIALDTKGGLAIRYYRLDRMTDIQLGEEHYNTEQIDMRGFDIRTFDMFSSEEVEMVTMRVHKDLTDLIIERFGVQVSIRPDFESEDHIIVHQEMGISTGLIRWILQQGSKVEILEPQHLREKVKEEVAQIMKYYEGI